jgi:hypothetical protein
MKADDLQALLDARPFHPFSIHLGDGRELVVNHPEFVAPSPTGDIVVVFRPEGGFNIVDVELVTDLEVRPRTEVARTGT